MRILLLLSVLSVSIAAHAAAEPAPLTAYPASMEEALARFPSGEASREAIALEQLVAPVGIDLTPRAGVDRARPSPERVATFRGLESELGGYVTMHLQDPGPRVGPPPDPVARFLSDHAEDLAAIRRALVSGREPRWDRHLEKLAAAPIPNLLGHIWLHKLLVADALAAAADGEDAAALEDLEASWKLNTSLRDEPAVICELIAVSVARLQAGALRKLRSVPAIWIDRLEEHSYRASMYSALWVEGWVWTQTSEVLGREEPDRWVERFARAASGPYLQLCLSNTADLWREYLTKATGLESLCDADLAELQRDLHASIPWWNKTAGILLVGLDGTLGRVARLEVDLELTSRVLRVDLAKRRTGAYPPELPGAERSSSCPSLRWLYDRDAREGPTITLSRQLEWPDVSGVLLPTRSVRR